MILEELNTFEAGNSGVLVHGSARDFDYSDGKDSELYLKTVLEQADDVSSASDELDGAIQDWATEYHLSSRRANLLRGIDLRPGAKVLEIGCGCGAITRYLGEGGLDVDALEGSSVRARLARLRCRGLDAVRIYCGNFNELELPDKFYDIVCLVGVAEYAARFMQGPENHEKPIVAFLERVKRTLKSHGQLVIAIENRVGLKYMLGAHEDHYGRRFIGIHNYFGDKDINTYTLTEWQEVFKETGLYCGRTYLPFPDYKLPTVLLSDKYVEENPYAFCHLDGVESRDYVARFTPNVRESILWEAASAGGVVERLSNSFLFVLSPTPEAMEEIPLYDFVHLPDFGRRREYCLAAYKRADEKVVERRSLFGAVGGDDWLKQRTLREPFFEGPLLSIELARALELEPDGRRFSEYLSQYVSYLKERGELNIDLTPSNIVVDSDGEYHAFDQEWEVEEQIDVEFLVFRALMVLVVKARKAATSYARDNGLKTVEDFILHVGDRVGLDLARGLKRAVDLEERFQDRVAVRREPHGTERLLKTELRDYGSDLDDIETRLYWRGLNNGFSEDRCRVKYVPPVDDLQTVEFALPVGAESPLYLRFDPCDEKRDEGIGFMRIHEVRVRSVRSGSGNGEILWALRTPDSIARYSDMKDIRYGESGLGSVFMVTGDDPRLEFELIPSRCLLADEYLKCEIDITVPYSRDYVLARDQHLLEADRMEEKGRRMEEFVASYRRLERELDDIKSTRFWSLFSSYVRARRWIDGKSKKAKLWRALFRNLGYRRGFLRLCRKTGQHVVRLTGRKPEVVGPPTKYEVWRDMHLKRSDALVEDGPLVSIIMPVYNASVPILRKAVDSVRRQTYGNWELCIADDASTDNETLRFLRELNDKRIKIRFLEKNLNISGATNSAAEMAGGDYLAFMDNDDELADDALNAVAAELTKRSPDLLYTDEDFIGINGHLDDPHFKSDYNPDLLLSHNYVTHLLVVSRSLFEKLGGFRSEYDGAQDYDLVLRAVEQANKIVHLSKPLYHWRKSETSTSMNPLVKSGGHQNARRALEAALERRGISASIEDATLPHFFRVRRTIMGEPRVTIVIPFRDKPRLLRTCIETILETTIYSRYNVVGISNNSRSSATYEAMQELCSSDSRVSFREVNTAFNFSRLVNYGAECADGEHIVLFNNDIEIITPDWIEGLLEHSQRPEIAAVGAKLYYPNNRVQHAGLGVGLGGFAGHLHKNFRRDSPGYFNRLSVTQNVSAVTGALMMIEKEKYINLNGFDEEKFSVAYNDVDFCLRAREAGFLNVFTPFVEAYHHESMSRGYEETVDKRKRFEREQKNLRDRHGEVLERGDPYYNPNFDQGRDDFRFSAPLAVL